MKYLLIIIGLILGGTLKAQFTGTDSLRNYNTRYITNNAATAFTNLRLHTLLRGMIDWIDTARAGTGGGGAVGVDTLWALNDSTIRYRKNGVFRNFVLKGVYDTRRKVDTLYKINDTTIGFTINHLVKTITIPGRSAFVDSVYRKSGQDSIFYRIAGVERAIKDSSGTSLTLNNVGTGYAILATPGGDFKRLNPGYGIDMDSTTTANTITIKADTAELVTPSDLNDAVATKLNISDTANKWLNDIRRRPGTDTVEKFKNGSWQFAYIDSTGGSGSGVTTMAPIGGSPNANAATISGSTLTLQPADGSFGGVVTTTAQTLPGNKTFTGRRTNFNGFAPRTNSQWLPTSRQPDSIYIANRYLGFGFIDMFASGTYVMVYTSAANHICQEGVVMLAKSKDQGRTWVSDTIVTGGSGYDVTMGGGGVSPSNRLIVFFQRLDNTTQNGIDLRIIYSDDEGETFSSEQTQSTASQVNYQMYGPLVKIGGDSLLLSWYGIDTGPNPDVYTSYVIKSGDDGATWSGPITVASSSASQYTESSFAYLGGQTVIGLIRRENNDSTFAQVISYDNGNTWAYQGRVSWGIQGTPAWLKTFTGSNGKKVVAAYYRSGTIGNFEERAIYGYADSLILGPSKWDLNTEVTLATALDGSGYITVCHPYDQMYGIGYYYDETLAQSDATIKFLTFPKGVNLPIGASSGISGLTAPRISIASSASTLTDYNSLKYESATKSLLINNVTPLAWAGHNGGVIEGGKASLVLSQDNFSAILQNSYIDTDYKGVGTGGASAFIQDNGNFYLFNTSSTSADATISWNTRLRIDATGAWHINGTPGVADQVLVSNGSGATPSWQTHVSSQWLDVVSPAGIKYSGGNLGVGIDAVAPLHIHAATTGVGNYGARISDNNSSNGAEFVLDYRGGGTNEKVKSIITDALGLNFGKRTDAFGTPSIQMSLTHGGNLLINTASDNGAKLQVNGDATVTDEAYDATAWNGSLEVPTKNAIRDKIESISAVSSINSQAGAVTITAGTGITTSTLSGDITIAFDRTNSDVPHTIATYLTDVNNSGTSETDLYSTTVGANKLINNGQSIHFSGTIFLSDVTATSQIRGYFAGVEFGNTGGITISGTGYLKVSGEVIRKTSTTASASLKVEGIGLSTDYVNQLDLTGLDFTTTNIFKVTGTAGGGSGGSNDITAKPGKLTFQSN